MAGMMNESSLSGVFEPLPDAKSLGEAVRRARRQQRLTQGRLAGLAGTGLRFISELERGKPGIALGKAMDVLAVLGLTLHAKLER